MHSFSMTVYMSLVSYPLKSSCTEFQFSDEYDKGLIGMSWNSSASISYLRSSHMIIESPLIFVKVCSSRSSFERS